LTPLIKVSELSNQILILNIVDNFVIKLIEKLIASRK